MCDLRLGDPRRAIEYEEQSLAIVRDIGDRAAEARARFNLAVILESQQRIPEARAHARSAAELHREIGHSAFAQQAQQLVRRLDGSE